MIRARSSSIGDNDSKQGAEAATAQSVKRPADNNLAFMNYYLNQETDVALDQQKMQNSLMRARASKDTLHSTE